MHNYLEVIFNVTRNTSLSNEMNNMKKKFTEKFEKLKYTLNEFIKFIKLTKIFICISQLFQSFSTEQEMYLGCSEWIRNIDIKKNELEEEMYVIILLCIILFIVNFLHRKIYIF